MRRLASQDAWIHTCGLRVRQVRSKHQRVEEVIRRTRHVKLTVFDITPEVHSNFHAVLAVRNRNHIRIGINIFVESLWVSGIGAKTHRTVVESDVGNTGGGHLHVSQRNV